jgi:hypothetical protein
MVNSELGRIAIFINHLFEHNLPYNEIVGHIN